MARRKPADPLEPVDVWILHLVRDSRAARGVPTSNLVRRLLKAALRVYGLRCVSITGRRTWPGLSPTAKRVITLNLAVPQ